jgi:hypothetical protein
LFVFWLDCFENLWIGLHEVSSPEQVSPVVSDEVALIFHGNGLDNSADWQRWGAFGLWVGLE